MKYKYNPNIKKSTISKAVNAVEQLILNRNKSAQTTLCYCSCGNELIASNCCVNDVYINNRNVVHFICDKCGENTYYDFDHPVPIELPLSNSDNIIEEYKDQFVFKNNRV